MGEYGVYDEPIGPQPRKKPDNTDTKQPYYWLCAIEKTTGTPIVDGPYNSEEEARNIGFSKIRDDWEVIPMKTRDRNRATAMFRHMRFMNSGDLLEVLKRTRHKI